MNIKTNEEVIHLIHGLLALSQCDKLGEVDKVKDAINRTKEELNDHEILIKCFLKGSLKSSLNENILCFLPS